MTGSWRHVEEQWSVARSEMCCKRGPARTRVLGTLSVSCNSSHSHPQGDQNCMELNTHMVCVKVVEAKARGWCYDHVLVVTLLCKTLPGVKTGCWACRVSLWYFLLLYNYLKIKSLQNREFSSGCTLKPPLNYNWLNNIVLSSFIIKFHLVDES